MSPVRFTRVVLVVAFFAGLLAWAGNLENFAPCSKSNDCKSLSCSQGRCAPSVQWNGQGKIGSECNNNGNCKSRTCKNRVCVAAPTPTPKATPKATSKPRTVVEEEDEPDDEPEEAPTPKLVLDACTRQLVTDELFADMPEHAVEICDQYDAETVARALKLFEGKYGVGISDTCRAIVGRTDADVECGKKAFDALPAEDRENVPFKIPVSCSVKQTPEELNRCTKDLMASVGPALREGKKESDAAYACATYDATTLDQAKKAVKAGYAGSFLHLCRTVDGRTKEELACARKTFAADFGNARSEYEFTMPPDCESRTPRKK